MVFFNWATMQMAAKIVYYGPGLCGKTSNLSYIYAKTAPNSRGEMVSLETESDRTLFFDLLPIEVGTIGGFKTRLQLYTVPGQVFYNTTRKLVLKGVDGLVFVADSQRPMREANLESISSLRANLEELALEMGDLPLVLQYNKRDLKNILTVEELNEDLNPDLAFPFFESSAINGDGVFETLKEITKQTLKKLRRRMASPQQEEGPRPRLSTAPPPPSAQSPAAKRSSISAASLARAAEEGVDESIAAASPPPPRAANEEPPAPSPPQAAPPAVRGETDPGPAFAYSAPDQPPAAVKPSGPEFDPMPLQEAGAEIDDSQSAESSLQPPTEDLEITAQAPIPSFDELQAEPPTPLELIEVKDDWAASEDLEDELPLAHREAVEAPVETADEAPHAAAQALPSDEPSRAEAKDRPTESDVEVEFDQTGVDVVPPPLKRVKVSNQLDILAELDGLRKQATMSSSRRETSGGSDLDLDSLLASPAAKRKDLRHKVERSLNSNIFARMRGVQVAIRIEDGDGQVIHTLDPVKLTLESSAASLQKLSLQFILDLENQS